MSYSYIQSAFRIFSWAMPDLLKKHLFFVGKYNLEMTTTSLVGNIELYIDNDV